jgi:glycosyltransferase involved in cell wall biosynthesis
LRVAVLIDRLVVGGVEKVAIEQVRALRQAGHDAHLLVLGRGGAGPGAFGKELDSVPVHTLADRVPRLLRGSAPVPGFSFLQTFHLTYPLFARWLLREGEYDVILCHGSYTAFSAYAISRVRHIPVVLFLWDPTFHIVTGPAYEGRALGRLRALVAPVARHLDRWLVQRATRVLLGSSAFVEYVTRLSGVEPVVLTPSRDVPRHVPTWTSRPKRLLAVTAWKRGKNPEGLLDALERCPKDTSLTLAGAWLDDEMLQAFSAEVARRGLSARVEITGMVTEAELTDLYADARLLIQSWESPGFGLSALEAGACATPAVIPRGQGSADLLGPDAAALFDLGDNVGFVRLVDERLRDPVGSAAMGLRARDAVVEHASSRVVAARLEKALLEASKSSGV